MENQVILTKEGHEKLRLEIEELKTVVREKIADEIEKAREQGDLSENASYKAAMEKKEMNEAMITKMEETYNTATIQEEGSTTGKISMGSTVKVKNLTAGNQSSYQIVGQTEADPVSGKISIQSPLGAAMIDLRKGAKFKVTMPAGENEFEVISVE